MGKRIEANVKFRLNQRAVTKPKGWSAGVGWLREGSKVSDRQLGRR